MEPGCGLFLALGNCPDRLWRFGFIFAAPSGGSAPAKDRTAQRNVMNALSAYRLENEERPQRAMRKWALMEREPV
jgi:hypothetical protein